MYKRSHIILKEENKNIMASSSSRAIIKSILGFRIFTLLLCSASLALGVITMLRGPAKPQFRAIKSYRYVLAAAAGGVLYSLLQLPFAIYHALKEKRLIRAKFLPMFDFYGDKVIAFFLASGVGLGFGITSEFDDEKTRESSERGYIVSGLLLAGFTSMALLTILTSMHRKGRGF